MKKKALVLTGVSVAAAAAVAFYGTVLFPGRKIKAFEAAYLRPCYLDCGESAKFTEYSAKIENGYLVENDVFSLMLPEAIVYEGEGSDSEEQVYKEAAEDGTIRNIVIVQNGSSERMPSLREINLNKMFEVDLPEPKDLEEGYEKLCGGYPDSMYEEEKCVAQLDLENFDYTDYNKAYAFCELSALKGIYGYDSDVYVYENGNICGVLYVNEMLRITGNPDSFGVIFNFYDTSNLNRSYSVQIVTESMDFVNGVINSITMK